MDSHPLSLTLAGGGSVSTVAKKVVFLKVQVQTTRGGLRTWQREGRGKEQQDHRQEVQSTQYGISSFEV